MIASAQTLRKLKPLEPFVEKTVFNGLSYGLSPAGYDIRIAQTVTVNSHYVCLASSFEYFRMPLNLLAVVHDKSTWARQGLFVQNTIIEPGWYGFLTLELTYHGTGKWFRNITIKEGTPIAQILFHLLDQETNIPYSGKYQNQPNKPIKARLE